MKVRPRSSGAAERLLYTLQALMVGRQMKGAISVLVSRYEKAQLQGRKGSYEAPETKKAG